MEELYVALFMVMHVCHAEFVQDIALSSLRILCIYVGACAQLRPL